MQSDFFIQNYSFCVTFWCRLASTARGDRTTRSSSQLRPWWKEWRVVGSPEFTLFVDR